MKRELAREWTNGIRLRYLPDEPDAYRTFIHLADLHCPRGGRVVDLGCGEEGYLEFLSGKAGEITGIDDRPLEGPYQRYIQADLDRSLPLDDASVDLALSKFMLEHLRNPPGFFGEVHRVLRPGGRLLLLTSNVLYYPYSVNFLLSRLLTQEKRMRLVRMFTGRPQEDVYPVFYRCNTPGRLREELRRAGFEETRLHTYSDCYVSAVIRLLGAVAVGYELAVNALGLEGVKGFILAEGVRG